MQNKITSKLVEISEIISINSSKYENYGLLSGIGGQALFLHHYDKFYNRRIGIPTSIIIDNTISSVLEYDGTSSFCSGVSGICYLLNYLNKEGSVSVCFDTDVNNYINSAIERNIKENNYEFLYGLMGICTYLISIPGQNNNRFDKILSFLNSSKEIVGVDNCTFR